MSRKLRTPRFTPAEGPGAGTGPQPRVAVGVRSKRGPRAAGPLRPSVDPPARPARTSKRHAPRSKTVASVVRRTSVPSSP